MNFFQVTDAVEKMSRCTKRPVGATIELNNKIVSCGFNHGIDEKCHCEIGKENPNCIHAEVMAFESDDDYSFKGGVLRVTYIPCLECARVISNHGIIRVYYKKHRNEPSKQQGIQHLRECGIEVLNEWSN